VANLNCGQQELRELSQLRLQRQPEFRDLLCVTYTNSSIELDLVRLLQSIVPLRLVNRDLYRPHLHKHRRDRSFVEVSAPPIFVFHE